MAKPLVILHGWGRGDLKKWQPTQKILHQAGFKVFLPPLPGFFGQPPPQKPWTLADYADYVTGYLKHHRLNQPIILGHSFGGSVAIKLSLTHPAKVRALILVNSSGIRSQHLSLRARAFWLLAKIGKLLFYLPPLILLRPLARWALYTLAGEKDYYYARRTMQPTLKNILEEDLTLVLSKISLPTLIVWGKQDTVTPPSFASTFHRLIPASRLEILDDATHALPFQQPHTLTRLVRDFVNHL